MAYTNTKTLTDLVVIPTYESSTNVIKRVSFDVKVYDDVIGIGTSFTVPVQSVLSSESLANNEFITANGTITQTEIVNWAYENVGGDSYYDTQIKPIAESKLTVELDFVGTNTYNVATIAI